MRTLFHLAITSFFSVLLFACTNKKNNPSIKIHEVSPWCIIGFDSLNRTPKQRISMLKQMGFTKYGYNKGKGDLSKMKDEFRLAKENNLQITSVFLWLNANRDSIGKLSSMNQELLNNLTEIDTKPTIWLSFSHNFFKNINQNESIEVATKMIKQIKLKADEIGCKLALYNHHGWFGNPYNQVEVLEKLNQDDISIVYNFHHAHEYVDEFPRIVKKIMPYLSYVNLNGVKKEGPKILPIGKGDFELKMIQQLLEEGYKGPWGILGHIKNEDVQKVLNRNIDGLKLINSKLNQH